MKHNPKSVFIKAKDGYVELTYEEYCSRCKGDPSYRVQFGGEAEEK